MPDLWRAMSAQKIAPRREGEVTRRLVNGAGLMTIVELLTSAINPSASQNRLALESLSREIRDRLKTALRHEGIETVDLYTCGLTWSLRSAGFESLPFSLWARICASDCEARLVLRCDLYGPKPQAHRVRSATRQAHAIAVVIAEGLLGVAGLREIEVIRLRAPPRPRLSRATVAAFRR